MRDFGGLIHSCEDLYAQVCFDPNAWPDTALADWIVGVGESGELDRETARELRRVTRAAQKLRRFWAEPPPNVPPDHGDFRTRVDIAVGVSAWRPLLAIARHGLEVAPDSALFEQGKELFRVVAGEHWMEGVSYEAWLSERG